MKNFVLLIFCVLCLITLQSCGSSNSKFYINEIVENKQLFEGRFYLSNNSYIELVEGSDDTVHILSSGQLLTVINPENNTYGEMPKLSGSYKPLNGIIKFSKNLNYTDGHDLEEDVSGNDIKGVKRTDITIKYINNKLNIKIEIYSNKIGNNINYIIANRNLVEE